MDLWPRRRLSAGLFYVCGEAVSPSKKGCNVRDRTDFQVHIGHVNTGYCGDESKREGRNDEIPDYFGFITRTSGLFRRRALCQRQWSRLRSSRRFRGLCPLSGASNPRRPAVQQAGWKSIRVKLSARSPLLSGRRVVTSQRPGGGVDGAGLCCRQADLWSVDSRGFVCRIPLL